MAGGIREIGRVLEPGGCLCICVLHPMAAAGHFDTREPDSPFTIANDYLRSWDYRETFEHDGHTMTFTSSAHSLETYARAIERAGLLIDLIREPPAPAEAVELDPSEARWNRLPIFLFLRARKLER